MKKRKPSEEINLSFYPEGYNGLDIFVEDFWSVHLQVPNSKVNCAASFDVRLGADKKDEVLSRARAVLKALKEAIR